MDPLLICTCGSSPVLSAAPLPCCRAGSCFTALAWLMRSLLPRTGTCLLLSAAESPSSIACRFTAPFPSSLLPRVYDSAASQGCAGAGMLLGTAAVRAGWLGDGHQVGGVHPAEPWQAVGGVCFQQQAVQGDLRTQSRDILWCMPGREQQQQQQMPGCRQCCSKISLHCSAS